MDLEKSQVKRLRAIFKGYTGLQLTKPIPGPFIVHVLPAREHYVARMFGSDGDLPRIQGKDAAETCRLTETHFIEKVKDWAWHDDKDKPTKPPGKAFR